MTWYTARTHSGTPGIGYQTSSNAMETMCFHDGGGQAAGGQMRITTRFEAHPRSKTMILSGLAVCQPWPDVGDDNGVRSQEGNVAKPEY